MRGYFSRIFDQSLQKEIWAFAKAMAGHWVWWVSTAFLSVVISFSQGVGGVIPHWLLWTWAIFGIVIAAFLAWREQYEKVSKQETERELAVRGCFQRAAQLLKDPTLASPLDFCAFFKAEPYKLKSNDEVIEVCNRLAAHGHKHPFRRIKTHVLENEWLEYLKWGLNHREFHFDYGGDYLKAAMTWNHKVKGRTDAPLGLEPSVIQEVLSRPPFTPS